MRTSSFCLVCQKLKRLEFKRHIFNFILFASGYIVSFCSQLVCVYIMASPGNKRGQRRGSCGHIMASFDLHEKCARCREKVLGMMTVLGISPVPFATTLWKFKRKCWPPPRIEYVKKTGILVSPEDVTVLASVDDREPAFHSPLPFSVLVAVHAEPEAGIS